MTDAAEVDPLAGFAALMAGARPDPDPAPYGTMVDPETGVERPKKAPGRPRKSPSLEDLKAAKEAESGGTDGATGGPASGDRPPAVIKRRGGRRARAAAPNDPKPAPPIPQQYRYEGGLAKGINRLYRKTGKVLIAFGVEPEGRALVEITRAEDDDDVTVGDAWETLCKTNPKVRAFWLRLLAGGAVSAVVMAHLPVVIAFVMRPGVAERVPFGRLFGAMASDEGEDLQASEQAPPDMAMMMQAAQMVAEQMRGNGAPVRGD